MANSQLLDKRYKIPDNIINYIQSVLIANPTGSGIRRAKFLINNNGVITFQALTRIKHDLENAGDNIQLENAGDNIQYKLSGGKYMLGFINSLFASETSGREISNRATQDSDIELNLGTSAQQNPRMSTDDLKI